MKFDSNLAWKQASAAILANREVLMALAGVFFLLPGLAVSLFVPQPQATAGMQSEAMLAMLQDYYLQALPYALPAAILQWIGTLAMLTLFTDRTRPTVAEAIRQGIGGLGTFLVAMIMLVLGTGVGGSFLLGIATLSGVPALAVFALLGVLALTGWATLRTSLVAPIVAVERVRNPVEALRRSWQLTKGNAMRLFLFYLLLGLGFFVVISVVMALLGIVIVLLAGENSGKIIAAVISSGLSAVATIYFVGVLASVHRQLAGTSTDVDSATFE